MRTICDPQRALELPITDLMHLSTSAVSTTSATASGWAEQPVAGGLNGHSELNLHIIKFLMAEALCDVDTFGSQQRALPKQARPSGPCQAARDTEELDVLSVVPEQDRVRQAAWHERQLGCSIAEFSESVEVLVVNVSAPLDGGDGEGLGWCGTPASAECLIGRAGCRERRLSHSAADSCEPSCWTLVGRGGGHGTSRPTQEAEDIEGGDGNIRRRPWMLVCGLSTT